MNDNNTRPKPWATTHYVSYEDNPGGEDQLYAPPGLVLQVTVVDDHAFLSVCKYSEDAHTSKTEEVSEVHVDSEALLNALIIQMGIERARLVVGALA